jgi:hypothetical protein
MEPISKAEFSIVTRASSKAWIPELIAAAGPEVTESYIDFFTATIRNRNTRQAYARACWQFFDWCAAHGLELTTVRPFHVAAWIEDFPVPSRQLSKNSLRCGCCTISWLFAKSHHRIRHIPFAGQSMWSRKGGKKEIISVTLAKLFAPSSIPLFRER